MIDQLITALSKEVEMSAEEIADTIWLALQMQKFQPESVSFDLNLRTEDEREINNQESQSSQGTLPKSKPEISELEETPNQSLEEQKAGIYPRNGQGASKSSDLSFKVPDAPSLREPLTLARALKPLMRRIPSGRELVLDEAATIQRIADEGLWIPVLRPAVEPWLDLELVVDEAISMQIWRHTIRELERLLKNYGIFRDVRVWGLITDENEQVQIRRGIAATARSQTPRSPKELIDPSGRRLVLLVSDCVSSVWRNGAVTPVLELWAKQGSMAIVQMLPKWLWKRTALGRASEVRLQGLTPGACNQKLIAKEVSFWDELDEETGVKVPVFTLEQDKVATWAQMLSGKGSIWTQGYVFKLNATPVDQEISLFITHGNLSAEQRVQAFRVTASPMARKLAGLLASAPVISLSIVRLIRETLLKDAQQVHVAEVFLGGLLKPLSEINADINPDYVQYEFMDGLRELLIDSVPSKYVLNVVDEVSKYVAKKAGLSLETFAAVLKNPQQLGDSEIAEQVGCFATVTALVLRCLGGEYVKVAKELESYNRLDSQENTQAYLDSLPNIQYQIGGCLPSDSSSYIKRKVDDKFYNAVKAGRLCSISASIQMGKSSLILQIIKRLKKERFVCAVIDLTLIGSNKINFYDFCYLLIYMLVRDFNLSNTINLKDWWEENKEWQSAGMIFSSFIEDILLKQVNSQIIIFIDELDWLIDTGLIEDFLMLLRGLYESQKYKSRNNTYYCNFVLSGIFTPSDLHSIENPHTSPFNIDVRTKLEAFSYEEALPLARGLAERTNNPQELLKKILEWTGGQPFLTQKLCQLVKESEEYVADGNKKAWLDNLVKTKIIERWEEQDSPQHLLTIENRILNSKNASEILKLYQLILQEEYTTPSRKVIQELILTGLVIRQEEVLRVANRIYAEVFNQNWIEQSLAILSSVTLNSNQEINYTQLRNLLAENQWREADEETFRLMLKATNREKEGTLDYQAIKNAPCIVLNAIDKLWINASKGRFGFSIQLQKWQEAGGKANKETEYKLGKDIGWYVNNEWLSDISKFTFDLSAPIGHLPVKWTFYLGGIFPRRQESVVFSDFANRLLECNINNLEIGSQITQSKIETSLQNFEFETVYEHLKQILHRVENGQQTDEDITFLRQLLLAGDRQIVQQLGKYNVNIGEGKEIHIGDRIYQQWDEQAIQALVKAIQKVTWLCVANLTENDYTQVESQSTGIGIIDILAKNLTDFSQQSVMRYGLKLAFSPNSNQEYFISGGNQVIKRWQTNTREILQEISVPFSPTGIFDLWLTSVAISPDGQLIAACKAYQINIWRLGTSNVLHSFGKTFLSNFLDVFGFDSITFSPNGKILAANDNQDIKLWDVESGKEIAKLSGHSDKVTCVAFNPTNGRILASCSYDKTIKLWDIDSKRCLGTLSAHRDAVYTLAFSPDGEILASGSNDNTIKLWHLNTGETPQTLRQHSDAVTCLVFNPDGKTLVSGSNDETIVEWEITKKESKILPERHRRGVTSIAFSPDGETLISGGRDQTIKVWRR